MKRLFYLLAVTAMTLCLTSGKRQIRIFVIGDSTAAEKSHPETNLERGWAMVLQGYFDKHVCIENHAVNGRSSKSFLNEGRWGKVLERIKPGDYVFIQFGHNDEKNDSDRHTEPGTTFDSYLERYVDETRARGGIPVLFNSVVRRNFSKMTETDVDDELLRSVTYSDENVSSDTLVDTHGAYKDVPRHVALRKKVVFIDANRITHDLEQGLGVEGSRKLHMWFRPGVDPRLPQGRKDNTHYNICGARMVASLLADAIGKEIKELGKHVVHFDYVVSARGRGNYLTLKEAVEAIPSKGRAMIYVLDGQWEIDGSALCGKKTRVTCYPGAEVKIR